jgi:hypothetical protein
MPFVDFDYERFQKVRYVGRKRDFRNALYVVSLSEFDFYNLNSNDQVVIHLIDRNNRITLNENPDVRRAFIVRKEDLQMEGHLVTH